MAAKEDRLSDLWYKAYREVGPLDHELAEACATKGLGWIKPDVWQKAKEQVLKLSVNDLHLALLRFNQKRRLPTRTSVPNWFPVAGVCFAAVTALFVVFYLVQGPALDTQKKLAFDALIALCVSCSAAFLGGTAAASGSIPFFLNSPIKFSAVASACSSSCCS